MPALSVVVATLATLFIVSRLVKYRSDRQKTLGLPGLRAVATPLTAIGALLPTSFLNPGLEWQWYWRNEVYKRMGTDTISIIGWLFGDPLIYTSSMTLARQIVAVRGPLKKPIDSTRSISQWGPNLFQVNAGDWRRHRRIVQPAFNGDIYKLVWKEASNLFHDMAESEHWSQRPFVDLAPANTITTKFTLKVISRCAFGNYSPWASESEPNSADLSNTTYRVQDSSAMEFTEALAIASESSLVHLVTPRWMYKLPIQWLRKVDVAYRTLGAYMESLVASRKAELSGQLGVIASSASKQKQDLFSLMIQSSEDEGATGMSDEELISNTYLMLFAGHDTTSHTLVATLGFLAVYQDVQQDIYEEIKNIVSNDPDLSFEAYPKLVKTQAAFLEAGRLFPAGFIMIREATEDMVLTTDDPYFATSGGCLAVTKGTTLVVDMVGLHYNERYFPDPEEFRPSR